MRIIQAEDVWGLLRSHEITWEIECFAGNTLAWKRDRLRSDDLCIVRLLSHLRAANRLLTIPSDYSEKQESGDGAWLTIIPSTCLEDAIIVYGSFSYYHDGSSFWSES